MVSPRESYIEQDVCEYAEDTYSYIAIKLTSSNSRNGLPDRLFIGNYSNIFFIEFKRKDEEPGKLQLYYHKLLRSMGFRVYVVDNKKIGKEIIDKEAIQSSIKKKKCYKKRNTKSKRRSSNT